jgi:hypothetical protein
VCGCSYGGKHVRAKLGANVSRAGFRRHQAIVAAGRRDVGRQWALSGPVRVCLLTSRPQVRVLLGAQCQHVEDGASEKPLPGPATDQPKTLLSSRLDTEGSHERSAGEPVFARLGHVGALILECRLQYLSIAKRVRDRRYRHRFDLAVGTGLISVDLQEHGAQCRGPRPAAGYLAEK